MISPFPEADTRFRAASAKVSLVHNGQVLEPIVASQADPLLVSGPSLGEESKLCAPMRCP
jgi:hypothetical protein